MAEIDKDDCLPCPDWSVSTLSNAHIATDRKCFDNDYVSFPSHVYSFGQRSEVVGVGTVSLPVKTSLTTKGPGSHGILRLCNVLHVPTGGINIIGNAISDDFYLQVCTPTAKVAAKLMSRKKGKTAALLNSGPGDMSCMYLVKLSGYPVGPRVGPSRLTLHLTMVLDLRSDWPLGEQEKYFQWKYRRGGVPISAPDSPSLGREKSNSDTIDATRKTLLRHRDGRQAANLYFPPKELDYVKNDWGDTASLMDSLCLNTYTEDDCVRAKNIASNFADLYHQEDKDWEGCEDRCKPHNVDRLFTKRQLYHINRDHGNSSLFMSDMAFDIYNEDDCVEAQYLAEDLCIEGDGDDDDDEYYLDEYGLHEEDIEEYELSADGIELVNPEILGSRSRDQELEHLNIGTYVKGPRQLAEHFLSEELNFVDRTYDDSMSFMTCFNLKFYKEEDCLETKSIAAACLDARQEYRGAEKLDFF